MKIKNVNNYIGYNISECLYQKRKSQSWLAQKCGVSKSHINQIVKGKVNPSISLLTSISKTLEIDVNAIVSPPLEKKFLKGND